MDPHYLPQHSFKRLFRASLLSFVALESLAGCTGEETSNPHRSSGTGTTTSGGGSTATTSTGTATTGTGTSTTTGTPTTGTTGGNGTGSGGSGTGTGSGGTTGAGGSSAGAGGTGTGAAGSSTGGAGPGTGSGGTGTPPGGGAPDASRPPGTPPGAEKIIGIDFMRRVVGKWSGTNQSGPLGTAFPMTVDFAPDTGFMYGKLQLDPQNTVVWGFNIETYGGKDVLAYRNGGFLAGAKRDSRLQLVEYDAARGYYRFCAVKEQGFPVDGCNYINARYTFSAPDKMLFDVTTQAGKPHVHWDATRIETHTLPDPFPANAASQGQGEAPWPPGAGL